LKKISHLHLDFLAEIYQSTIIETNNIERLVSSAELAQRMLTSQSSVNRIIERLNVLNLIEYERYVGVKLNDSGRQCAQNLLRKQSIIESFLMQTLNLGWHEIYHEALQLRHHVSDMVLNRMLEITNHPSRSPFGEPINYNQHNESDEVILTDADIKTSYVIERVLTRQSDRLQYLSALHLLPGTSFELLHKAPFAGPIQIQLVHEYRILGYELSKMITVRRVG